MWGSRSVTVILALLAIASCTVPLRFMSANVGNAKFPETQKCWEDKLCSQAVMGNVSAFVKKWSPDVVLLMEVMREEQLEQLLPRGWRGICGSSVDRFSGLSASWNASNASHQHECVAWKSNRFAYINSSSIYGRNDNAQAQRDCHYDFTAFLTTLWDAASGEPIHFVAVHPDSEHDECKLYEISQYWEQLATAPRTIVAGDWNSGLKCLTPSYCINSTKDMQIPSSFRPIYLVGKHFDGFVDATRQPTAVYGDGLIDAWLDASFTNFGEPCTNCGRLYGTVDLVHGSAVGGYNGIPRADGGYGCDHRQLLVDLIY